jgi:hypothetical protein
MANVKISQITNGDVNRNLAATDLLEIENAGGDSYYITGTDLTSGIVTTALVSAVGAVMLTDFNAQTILSAVSDNTPVALTVTEQSLVGRITAGNIAALTATQVRTLLNVEDGADVTDATNVNAAGAVMESDYNAQTVLSATSDNTPVALTVSEETVVGRITGGNVGAINPSTVRRPITTLNTGTIFSLSHAGNIVEMNSTNTVYLTIPINAGIAFPVGTAIDIVQYGVAGVNVTTSVGVTLVRRSAFTLALAGQYSVATIYKRATDEWVLAGDLTTA